MNAIELPDTIRAQWPWKARSARVNGWRMSYVDEGMGDEVRVTVIAAGFERWEDQGRAGGGSQETSHLATGVLGLDRSEPVDIFAEAADDGVDLGDDDFDVPSFLR